MWEGGREGQDVRVVSLAPDRDTIEYSNFGRIIPPACIMISTQGCASTKLGEGGEKGDLVPRNMRLEGEGRR